MKILSCYIANFGCIKNKEYKFNEHLNSFCEDNGQGKSTLAAFIRAMFYGLPKSSNKSFDREHYIPFDNIEALGNIIFIYNNKEYKIERTFFKNIKDDDIKIYENGKINNDLLPIPGEIIFGLDLDSFNRTMFIYSNDLEINSTDNINSKMSHYIEDSTFDLNEVIDKLDKYKKKLKPSRLADEKGLIADVTNTISKKNEDLNNLYDIKNNLSEKYKLFNGLNDEIKELNNKLSKAASINEIINNWNRYDDYNQKIYKGKKEVESFQEKYQYGLPNDEELKINENNLNEMNYINTKKSSIDLTQLEKDKLIKYNSLFKEIPSKDTINEYSSCINDYYQKKNYKIEELNQNEIVIYNKYINKNIDDSIFNQLNDFKNEYLETKKQYDLAPNYIIKKTLDITKNKSYLPLILSIISILIIILGIGLGFINNLLFIISGIGLILLFVAGFIYLKNQINDKQLSYINEEIPNQEKEELNQKLNSIINKIDTIIMQYGFSSSLNESIDVALTLFKNEYDRYLEIKDKYNKIINLKENNQKEINSLEEKIKSFFNQYNFQETNYNLALQNLIASINEYQNLKNKKENIDNKINELDKKYSSIKDSLDKFISKYHINQDVKSYIDTVRVDKVVLDKNNTNLNNLMNEFNKFVEEKKLYNRPENIEKIDTNTITKQLSEKNELLSRKKDEIANDELEIEKIDTYNNEILESKEKLQELKYKYKIVDETIKSIKEAEETLKHKYIEPMLNKFNQYSSMLGKIINEEINMDSDYNLSVIHNGKEKNYRHLSSGQLSLCALCYRLSIIDNIFKEDKPFIIMDDIFVNLDENNLIKAIELLKKLSNQRQIIYFTCHESRNIID